MPVLLRLLGKQPILAPFFIDAAEFRLALIFHALDSLISLFPHNHFRRSLGFDFDIFPNPPIKRYGLKLIDKYATFLENLQ